MKRLFYKSVPLLIAAFTIGLAVGATLMYLVLYPELQTGYEISVGKF